MFANVVELGAESSISLSAVNIDVHDGLTAEQELALYEKGCLPFRTTKVNELERKGDFAKCSTTMVNEYLKDENSNDFGAFCEANPRFCLPNPKIIKVQGVQPQPQPQQQQQQQPQKKKLKIRVLSVEQ